MESNNSNSKRNENTFIKLTKANKYLKITYKKGIYLIHNNINKNIYVIDININEDQLGKKIMLTIYTKSLEEYFYSESYTYLSKEKNIKEMYNFIVNYFLKDEILVELEKKLENKKIKKFHIAITERKIEFLFNNFSVCDTFKGLSYIIDYEELKNFISKFLEDKKNYLDNDFTEKIDLSKIDKEDDNKFILRLIKILFDNSEKKNINKSGVSKLDEFKEMKKQLETFKSENEHLKKENIELNKENNELKKVNTELKKEMNEQLEALKSEVEQLKKEIDELNSKLKTSTQDSSNGNPSPRSSEIDNKIKIDTNYNSNQSDEFIQSPKNEEISNISVNSENNENSSVQKEDIALNLNSLNTNSLDNSNLMKEKDSQSSEEKYEDKVSNSSEEKLNEKLKEKSEEKELDSDLNMNDNDNKKIEELNTEFNISENHTNIGTENHTNIDTENHTNIGTENQTNIDTENQTNINTENQTNIGTENQTNINTDEILEEITEEKQVIIPEVRTIDTSNHIIIPEIRTIDTSNHIIIPDVRTIDTSNHIIIPEVIPVLNNQKDNKLKESIKPKPKSAKIILKETLYKTVLDYNAATNKNNRKKKNNRNSKTNTIPIPEVPENTITNSIPIPEPSESEYLSSIVSEENKLQMKSWIGYDCEFELLYLGKRDGKRSRIFHEKCDRQGATISLIKTDQGNLFGGYTDWDWDTDGEYRHREKYSDRKTFLFSLDLNRKYPYHNGEEIFCGNGYFFAFGNQSDYILEDNWQKSSAKNFPYNFGIRGVNEPSEFLPENHTVIEVIVYKVKKV
jgi:hypothetical protein